MEAFNGVSMGVVETYVGLPGEVRPKTQKGNLFILTVGVNKFPALPRRNHLNYAAQDAEELGQVWAARSAENYGHTWFHNISDNSVDKPDQKTIVSALKFVEQAGPDDTVLIFLASHGLSDRAGNYYFVPRDVTAAGYRQCAKR